jgi:Rps23 Pro-64 3,4-dihydroxylase Tpa1-like proline 4-hydroxylase
MFQVAEVAVIDRTRLSVNGWFHGPIPERSNIVPNAHIDVHLFYSTQVTVV